MPERTQNIPADQHDCICDLMYWQIDNPGKPALPGDQTPEGLKPFNLLLRRGFVIRFEFTNRKMGYLVTDKAVEYLLATEPDHFSLTKKESPNAG